MGARRARAVVLDAGALIQFDRGDERMRALISRSATSDVQILIPAGALAQAWRDGRRQARLAALVAADSTVVETLDEPGAKAAGALCGRAGTADIVDASVVLTAELHAAPVVTTDASDLRRLDANVVLREL